MGRVLVAAVSCATMMACAHAGRSVPSRPALGAGMYAVESIRSRATLDGVDRVIEISEAGTKMVDGMGSEHLLTERGALSLNDNGVCRLALAVSVDGEDPGVSDRTCTWSVSGDQFFLGDMSGAKGTRTVYLVQRLGKRLVLEGLKDVGPDGQPVGDAVGERIVLIERSEAVVPRPADRASEQAAQDVSEYLHEL